MKRFPAQFQREPGVGVQKTWLSLFVLRLFVWLVVCAILMPARSFDYPFTPMERVTTKQLYKQRESVPPGWRCVLCGCCDTPLRRMGPGGRPLSCCNACGIAYVRREKQKKSSGSKVWGAAGGHVFSVHIFDLALTWVFLQVRREQMKRERTEKRLKKLEEIGKWRGCKALKEAADVQLQQIVTTPVIDADLMTQIESEYHNQVPTLPPDQHEPWGNFCALCRHYW